MKGGGAIWSDLKDHYRLDAQILGSVWFFVAFIEDNATMSSIRYFENHVSYFVPNRRK